nr:MAG TPA: hypothetical protein [Caudoviricetes sp.]
MYKYILVEIYKKVVDFVAVYFPPVTVNKTLAQN